jgi:hypothetical protein
MNPLRRPGGYEDEAPAALNSTRVDVMPALKESGTSVPRDRGSSLHVGLGHLLMVSQVAVTLVVVAAGLFVRTLGNLWSVALGFHPEDVLTFRLDARQAGHRAPEIAVLYENLRWRSLSSGFTARFPTTPPAVPSRSASGSHWARREAAWSG